MADTASQPPNGSDRPAWLSGQFSLKTLLVVVTVVAVVLGLGSILPALFGSFFRAVLCSVAVPALLITAIHARGPPQAFAQGALATTLIWQAMMPSESFVKVVIWLAFSALGGLVGIFAREWIRLQGWDES